MLELYTLQDILVVYETVLLFLLAPVLRAHAEVVKIAVGVFLACIHAVLLIVYYFTRVSLATRSDPGVLQRKARLVHVAHLWRQNYNLRLFISVRS